MYIFGMCDCPFKVRSIHIFGAMNGLVAMEVGGGGHAESDWGVWLRHWRLSVLTFAPAPIPKEGGLSSVTLSGRLE